MQISTLKTLKGIWIKTNTFNFKIEPHMIVLSNDSQFKKSLVIKSNKKFIRLKFNKLICAFLIRVYHFYSWYHIFMLVDKRIHFHIFIAGFFFCILLVKFEIKRTWFREILVCVWILHLFVTVLNVMIYMK